MWFFPYSTWRKIGLWDSPALTTVGCEEWNVLVQFLWVSHTAVFWQSDISKGSASLPELYILYNTVLRISRFNLNFEKQPGTCFFIFFVRPGIIERKIGKVWHIRSIDPMSLLLSRLFISNYTEVKTILSWHSEFAELSLRWGATYPEISEKPLYCERKVVEKLIVIRRWRKLQMKKVICQKQHET